MNKILTRWGEAGLLTLKQVKEGDKKPTAPKGASGKPGQAELDAIAKLLKEG
jgi:DNA replication protein DnaD